MIRPTYMHPPKEKAPLGFRVWARTVRKVNKYGDHKATEFSNNS